MPELPEAETIARELRRRLKGRTIRAVRARVPSLRRRLNLRKLRRDVMGREIIGVRRRGKALVVELSGKRAILLQLGMTGGCRLCACREPVKRHEHVIFKISGGRDWRFEDPRRFGMVESFPLARPNAWPEFLKKLGPEALDDGFSAEYLFAATRKRRRSIKELLLAQGVVAGIGNIYASEILFWGGCGRDALQEG